MSAIEYRRAVQSDYAKCVDFANLVFSAAYRPHDFKALSPKVYATPDRFVSAPHYLAVEPDGSVRGMVGVLPNTLKVGRATLKTGFIGTTNRTCNQKLYSIEYTCFSISIWSIKNIQSILKIKRKIFK